MAEEIKKDEGRLKVLARIEEFEKKGILDAQVEDDPVVTRYIEPGEVDWTRKKLKNKIMRYFTFKVAEKMYKKNLSKLFVIKDIVGLENLRSVKSGAILTSNHFAVTDSFAMELMFRQAKIKGKRMYRVIKESNYTDAPKAFMPLMKYCNTLPLAKNKQVMREFIRAVDTLLKRGDFVLVYPEQEMWWNYKKPRILHDGAFHFAAKNKVPVIPCFITLEDSDIIGDDGFPVQNYTIHIEKPIYNQENLTEKENTKYLKEQNEIIWKKIYEDTYKTKLTYLK